MQDMTCIVLHTISWLLTTEPYYVDVRYPTPNHGPMFRPNQSYHSCFLPECSLRVMNYCCTFHSGESIQVEAMKNSQMMIVTLMAAPASLIIFHSPGYPSLKRQRNVSCDFSVFTHRKGLSIKPFIFCPFYGLRWSFNYEEQSLTYGWEGDSHWVYCTVPGHHRPMAV